MFLEAMQNSLATLSRRDALGLALGAGVAAQVIPGDAALAA